MNTPLIKISRLILGAFLGIAHVIVFAQAAEVNAPLLDQWFQSQSNVTTWCADVVQTRRLKTLTMPLVSTGKVWALPPSQFRWQLGDPPKTVVLRHADELSIFYPPLKRMEHYSLAAAQAGPWRDVLGMLEISFPRSRSDVESRFTILETVCTNEVLFVRMIPRSASARRMLESICIGVSTNSWQLTSTQLSFAEGTVIRNDFSQTRLNTIFPTNLFVMSTNEFTRSQ